MKSVNQAWWCVSRAAAQHKVLIKDPDRDLGAARHNGHPKCTVAIQLAIAILSENIPIKVFTTCQWICAKDISPMLRLIAFSWVSEIHIIFPYTPLLHIQRKRSNLECALTLWFCLRRFPLFRKKWKLVS